MRILCVAEKPSQAKAVVQILGNGQTRSRSGKSKYNLNYDFQYRVNGTFVQATMTSVSGHVMSTDFPESMRRWKACDPVTLFSAPIVKGVDDKTKDTASNIKQEARTATHLYIWTDCDREGEAIGGDIAELCREANSRIIVRRAHFSSVLAQEIHHAMQNTRELDMRLVDAVRVRSEVDLRVGSALTRFQTLRLQSRFRAVEGMTVSYGPCQFPTLGFVVDQFLRVENFVQEPFWLIFMQDVRADDSATFAWKRNRLFDQETCLALYAQCLRGEKARVDAVRSREKQKWRPLPLTTVELQKCCARYLRIAPDVAMSVAEGLYNQGFLSYPRTETDQFDDNMDLRSIVTNMVRLPELGGFAQRLVDGSFQRPRKGRNNDKAHPPIHPVAAATGLQGDAKRVYEFVTRRFLACCSDNAKGQATEIDVSMGGELFSTSGLMITARNYLDIYPYERWSESTVPLYRAGELFEPSILEQRSGMTTAPKLLRYSDLIEAMDKNGIGTDATHADHIKKIIDREYIFKAADDSLAPSSLGVGLKEGYDAIGLELSLCKPHLRREMERDLRLISEGVKTKDGVLRESLNLYKAVYKKAVLEVEKLENALSRCMDELPFSSVNDAWRPQGEPEEVCRCPENDGGVWTLRALHNRPGWMVGCNCYPQCRYSVWLTDCVDAVSVGATNCSTCSHELSGPAKLIDVSFKPGSVPPGVPSMYSGCVRGCDDLFNELFNVRPIQRASNVAASRQPTNSNVGQHSGAPNQNFSRPGSTQSFHQQQPQPPLPSRSFSPPSASSAQPAWAAQRPQSFQQAPVSSGGHSFPASDNPLCKCSTISVQRTTTKEGANKGRTFFVCSKSQDTRCDFFQWTDQPDGNSRQNNKPAGFNFAFASSSHTDPNAPVKPQCKCGLYATLKETVTAGPNFGREYFFCTKAFQGCGFVCWKDEVDEYVLRASNRSSASNGMSGGAASSVCYTCGNTGHWSRDCPSTGSGGGAGAGTGGGLGGQSQPQTFVQMASDMHSRSAGGATRSARGRRSRGASSGRSRARGARIARGRGGRASAAENDAFMNPDPDPDFEFWT